MFVGHFQNLSELTSKSGLVQECCLRVHMSVTEQLYGKALSLTFLRDKYKKYTLQD